MDMPYRLYVPTTWDGQSKLPLILMLHGAGADENRYLDMNDRQMLRLAEQHGYVLASPLGYSRLGAYGTPLRLPAVFGQPEIAAKQRATLTPEAEHTLELSEKDVINVLEIVLNEYPINRLQDLPGGPFHGRRRNMVPGREIFQILARYRSQCPGRSSTRLIIPGTEFVLCR